MKAPWRDWNIPDPKPEKWLKDLLAALLITISDRSRKLEKVKSNVRQLASDEHALLYPGIPSPHSESKEIYISAVKTPLC